MTFHSRGTFDRIGGKRERDTWVRARKTEIQFTAKLRRVAQFIGQIVRGFDLDTVEGQLLLQSALQRYAQTIKPWAEAVTKSMVAEVAARNQAAWIKTSEEIGRAVRQEIMGTPRIREIMAEQVELITSLPLDAAKQVHRLTQEGIAEGVRASEIAARIHGVTESRALLIARTEVSRTATVLTQVRSESVGSVMFIWRTSKDENVRPSHRKLEGQAFRWDDPPECDPGYRALPGAIFNCRCHPEPIIPGVD